MQIDQYTLCKDVAAAQRRPHSPGTEFLSPPIVVLNNMQVRLCQVPELYWRPPESGGVSRQLQKTILSTSEARRCPLSPGTAFISPLIVILNNIYLTETVYKVVLPQSIPVQIRQLVLDYY